MTIQPIWRNLIGDERTEKGKNRQKQHSPLFFVENITNPLLITHGSQIQMSRSRIQTDLSKQ
jgi:dipeptidyl aminopeptidase/acylaminoacyl peptidase